MRTIFPCKVRTEWDWTIVRGQGDDGISKKIRLERERSRRVASRAPPALIFTVTVKSRKSFPDLSWPLTKSGIANGSLCQ
jgi:hypothetical protein